MNLKLLCLIPLVLSSPAVAQIAVPGRPTLTPVNPRPSTAPSVATTFDIRAFYKGASEDGVAPVNDPDQARQLAANECAKLVIRVGGTSAQSDQAKAAALAMPLARLDWPGDETKFACIVEVNPTSGHYLSLYSYVRVVLLPTAAAIEPIIPPPGDPYEAYAAQHASTP